MRNTRLSSNWKLNLRRDDGAEAPHIRLAHCRLQSPPSKVLGADGSAAGDLMEAVRGTGGQSYLD
jgi:hypothetical protein